jgi:hypothetical protein
VTPHKTKSEGPSKPVGLVSIIIAASMIAIITDCVHNARNQLRCIFCSQMSAYETDILMFYFHKSRMVPWTSVPMRDPIFRSMRVPQSWLN